MAQILKSYGATVNDRVIAEAVDTLRRGGIIVYPTDTMYALGCDALNKRAVERLCRVKGLDPEKNLLSVVCSGLSQAAEYARIDNAAYTVMKDSVPGPVTFILPSSTRLQRIFKGRRTVGVRIPDCATARALAAELGNPLLTTSVHIDDADAADAANPESLAMRYDSTADIVIDGGEGPLAQSAIIDITDPTDPVTIREHAALG